MFPSPSAKLFPDIDPNPFGFRQKGVGEADTLTRVPTIDEAPLAREPIPAGEFKNVFKSAHVRGMAALGALIMLTFIGKAVHLQLVRGASFAALADSNRLRTIPLDAPRGLILSRDGVVLAKNIPSFSLYLSIVDLPDDPVDEEMLLNEVSARTKIARGEIESRIKGARTARVALIRIKDALDPKEALVLTAHATRFPALIVEERHSRSYAPTAMAERSAFAHIIGYEGSISPQELIEKKTLGYTIVDRIGKTGIEKGAEGVLRGSSGVKKIEVNAAGEHMEVRAEEPPIPGQTIELAVDAGLQQFAYAALERTVARVGGRGGALVALDPKDGEVLALASYPSFDHEAMSRGMASDAFAALLKDMRAPFLNRAIGGTYPSGSIAKLFVAVGALEEGVITPATTILSTGGIRVGRWFFPDWRAGGHGATNLKRAIAESVNSFFFIVGGGLKERTGLGAHGLEKWFKKFGLGVVTGIELTGEKAGFIPTPQWKQRERGGEWYIGDTYNLAIGQGDLLVTPLQVARATAALLNGGILVQPHLVRARYDHVGKRNTLEYSAPHTPVASPPHLSAVQSGMRAAVQEGSARALNSLPFYAAGKTGTAQWSKTRRPHAWFTGYAERGAKTVVITVLIEEGGEGSAVAVPVAREVLLWWYEHGV